MSTTYQPQDGVFPGRPPCRHCGAAYRLHFSGAAPAVVLEDSTEIRPGVLYLTKRGRDRLEAAGALTCPQAYRPGTLEVAERELRQAEATGDQARVFVARGNLQRLTRRKDH